jgi:hypothetical protein
MGWVRPEYSREIINAAASHLVRVETVHVPGRSRADWDAYFQALEIVNNWRASHGYPLNTFQMNLRNTARRFDPNAIVAQRIKRMASITYKLQRFPNMKLTQMQDLGGCRAIVNDVAMVRRVVTYYERKSAIKHERATLDDYISEPKPSGYRGVHLVYRYFSDKEKRIYNGLKIEMQIRSTYQHAWATAVETVGTFSGEALKSSVGSAEWQRFFALMGSAIALRERAPLVPGTPTERDELVSELKHYAETLNVIYKLQEYRRALNHISEAESGDFFLLELDPWAGRLNVTGFKYEEVELATERYAEAEKRVKEYPGTDAVLVSVDSVRALERAYPNYFADTRIFIQLVEQFLSGRRRQISAPRQLTTPAPG